MNERERFIETMTCGNPDRPSLGDYLSYDSTRERWEREGMPKGVNLYRHFGFDHIDIWGEDSIPFDWSLSNLFKRELLEENSTYAIWKDSNGGINKYLKNMPPPAMPLHISFPVRDKKSWLEYKERLLRTDLLSADFTSNLAGYKSRDVPLGLWAGSSYGIVRNLIGLENLSLMIYDNPRLIEEMMEVLTDVYVSNFSRVVDHLQLDWVMFWEDMSYKNGALISPAKYKELFSGFYNRIMPIVESAGVKVVMLDSDGNIEDLIPIWLELGITTMHPMEVNAGMDVRKIRKQYGKDIKFLGGINKQVLGKDKDAIKKEVEPKIRDLIDGGFIVQCDHAVPPDVSYDNFRYYRDLVEKLQSE